jgi:hypothetical protein
VRKIKDGWGRRLPRWWPGEAVAHGIGREMPSSPERAPRCTREIGYTVYTVLYRMGCYPGRDCWSQAPDYASRTTSRAARETVKDGSSGSLQYQRQDETRDRDHGAPWGYLNGPSRRRRSNLILAVLIVGYGGGRGKTQSRKPAGRSSLHDVCHIGYCTGKLASCGAIYPIQTKFGIRHSQIRQSRLIFAAYYKIS